MATVPWSRLALGDLEMIKLALLTRLLPTLVVLLLAALSAGCATSGAPVATDERALCEGQRGGGVWMAGAGVCLRNGI
jgi:hypothetical protein